MNDKHQYKDEHGRFFEKAEIPYARSKEDVWKDMLDRMEDKQKPAGKTRKLIIYWSAAAIFIMLLGIAGFMRFYSKGLYALPGQHLSKVLPDGSKVHLNAGTRLSYHPHWWRFTRILELDGEAYFEVEKGKKFVVRSQQGKTEVLGTSFNIYSRNSEYRVYCLTGQVKVQTDVGEGKILQANQSLSLTEKGDLEYQSDIKADNAISWTRNEFVFTAVPLSEVFKEMERQFDIEIELGQGVVGEYTGNFERGSSPSNTLEMITRPFGLYVERIHQNKYRISREKD